MVNFYRLAVEAEEFEGDTFCNVRFLQYINTFFRETSLQGFPQLVKQPGIVKKFVWICFIALMAFGLYYELQVFFDSFLQWEATTSMTVEKARKLYFPAVTLCNNNPVTSTWYKAAITDGGTTEAPTTSPGLITVNALGSSAPVAQVTGMASGALTEAVTAPGVTGALTGAAALTGTTLPPPTVVKRRKRQLLSATASVNHLAAQTQSRPDFSANMQKTIEIQAAVSKIPYNERQVVGHSLCDMVMECQFAGVECNPQTAFDAWHYNSQFGNCYTFNGGYKKAVSPADSKVPWEVKIGGYNNNSGVRISTLSGDTYGLYLLLHADIDHYLESTTQLGWRIVVHNQTEMPFPEEQGVFVAPGTSTHVGISQTYMERLGIVSNWLYSANYGNCIDQGDLVDDAYNNAYSNIMEIGYSASACLRTCYQREVINTCKCFDFLYPNKGSAFASSDNGTIYPCAYTSETDWSCKDGVFSAFLNGKLLCDCPEICESYSYSETLSSLKWPNRNPTTLSTICAKLNATISKRMYRMDSGCNTSSNIANSFESNNNEYNLQKELHTCARDSKTEFGTYASPDEIANYLIGSRFAEVYIYYKDFNYQTITEKETLAWSDLVAYLGGILGLFFGFSFLTLFEYIQLVIELIGIAIAKLIMLTCCKKKTNKVEDFEHGGIRRSGNDKLNQNNMKPPSGGYPAGMVGGYPVDTGNMYPPGPAKPPMTESEATAYNNAYYSWLYSQQQAGQPIVQSQK